MALITAKNLTIGYDSQLVGENINFTVEEGDYLFILGENGSGKSTLMKTILNLINPVSGEVLLGDGLKKNEIGYLPQQTAVQRDFPASVWEIVLSGCQNSKDSGLFYSKADKQKAREAMGQMGIEKLKSRCYRELSGGQQQRVLLARALCAAERILLLDEPISGLDPMVTAEMYHLIHQLNKSGITIIMISHDIQAAVSYASHVLHMGKTSFFGSRNQYMESPMGRNFLAQQEGGIF